MDFIVKFFSEIPIKSVPVRKKMVKQLVNNIKKTMRTIHHEIKVTAEWDFIKVTLPSYSDKSLSQTVSHKLSCIPGIANFSRSWSYPLDTLEDIADKVIQHYQSHLTGSSFAIRVRRTGKHTFTSVDAERSIGHIVHTEVDTAGVRLNHPDVLIRIEIKQAIYFLIDDKEEGLGGFPLGTQDTVLSLISGGFDSAVSSFMTMRRGVITHFCLFDMGGDFHKIQVKEIAYYLWQQYGISHPVQFITVPFQPVVQHLLTDIDPPYQGVILKRIMLKSAASIAKKMKCMALVTGESIAQVSSQTLTNLTMIDKERDYLVIRPLITTDKLDIIALAKKMGVYDLTKHNPEYCAVIAQQKSCARTYFSKVVQEEAKINPTIIEHAVAQHTIEPIEEVLRPPPTQIQQDSAFPIIHTPDEKDVIIDIRRPDQYETMPLPIANKINYIPIYKVLSDVLSWNNCKKRYLLYCQWGTISRLQAMQLTEQGYINVGVYLLKDETTA